MTTDDGKFQGENLPHRNAEILPCNVTLSEDNYMSYWSLRQWPKIIKLEI